MSESLRILLVEDNPADADLVRDLLPVGGSMAYQVESVIRLSAALERLARPGVAMVLLDPGLPDSQGLETFRRVRQAAPRVPVIVLTGNDDEDLALAAVREGAQDYLVKGRLGDGRLVRALLHSLERHKLEEEVRNSESKQDKMIANIGDVIVIIDRDGINRYKSPNIEKWFGWKPDEVVGVSTWDNVHPDDLERACEFIAGLMKESNVTGRTECRYRCKDGTYKWIEFTGVNLLDDPHVRGILGNYRDITERRQAREAMQESLVEKESLLKEIHHRVKNNLQIISSLLRMQSDQSNNPQVGEVLRDMQCRVRSMALIHEQLYRSENFAAVDLAVYLRQLCNQLQRTLIGLSGRVDLHLDLVSVSLKIDQAIPCGLLVNELVSNAFKHAHAGDRGGTVWVELHLLGDLRRIRLRVADDGVGLPRDFDLQQLPSLGLRLVSDLARQLCGNLEIEPGPGSGFVVEFPVDTGM